MPRPIQAVVHLDALQHNLKIAKAAAPNAEVYAVVKANAYGHGIERVYSAFQSADGFALLDLAEAQRLRALGWQGKILLLEGIFAVDDLDVCAALDLSFSLHSQHQIAWLTQFQQINPDAKFDVYLKLNSGMNRLGFQAHEYTDIFKQVQAVGNVRSVSHMTHFSDADGERFGLDGIEHQHFIFNKTIQGLAGKTSLSNSAAILRHHQTLHCDIVRSGIMLYGSSPDYPAHSIQDWNLRPTMSLRSEIIAIQTVQAGDSIGYGSKFIATQQMRIGVVACGYADGYQRLSATGTPVLVDSVQTQVLGRVSMDMLTVDLTAVPQATVGSEVVLWGKSSQGEILSIDEVAAGSGTVGYELMCAITARVPVRIES
ncbi:alanine racemase [Acinetobacter pseudolwoffii]|uniref:alanine racemase n=1 Tax=Acinetobacter pseudolwoffii TaxID=2053287 RepID=UPI000C243CFB|nr:alanine racemase [Acinetobacter pseudolwoffii]PJI29526.1 alanine racemase [Acinetobacter pseudolwoffii]